MLQRMISKKIIYIIWRKLQNISQVYFPKNNNIQRKLYNHTKIVIRTIFNFRWVTF